MTDINYGATLEALNNKVDLDLGNLNPVPADYIVNWGGF